MRAIVAIKFEAQSGTWYVRELFNRPSKRYGAFTTLNKHKAMDFKAPAFAQEVINNLDNPHNRVYESCEIEVIQPDYQAGK